MQVPVSIDSLCAYARKMVESEMAHLTEFVASRQWADSFFRRHNFSLRAKTSLSQRLPADLEEKLESFHNYVNDKRDQYDFGSDLIVNMDETPAYFDLAPGKTVNRTGEKSVLIRTTGAEKRHLTVVLAVAADGAVLPPMIIFKGKRALKDIKAPKGWIVCVQQKAWMDSTLMVRWIKEILQVYTKKKQSLCVIDSFRGHLTDEVKKQFKKSGVITAVIPGGCTSKIQPLDVSINKPFKSELRRSWNEWISNEASKLAAKATTGEKLKTASKQEIVDWIVNAVKVLEEKSELVRRSFRVCGISNHPNGSEEQLKRNDDYIKELLMDADSDADEADFEGFTTEDL
jgi:hypothetical protein